MGFKHPEENAREAAVVEDLEVYPVATLSQAVSFLNEQLDLESYELDGEPYELSKLAHEYDFADVRGQEAVKRAITIACAGAHNLLMCPAEKPFFEKSQEETARCLMTGIST